jgi:hypothetical protein
VNSWKPDSQSRYGWRGGTGRPPLANNPVFSQKHVPDSFIFEESSLRNYLFVGDCATLSMGCCAATRHSRTRTSAKTRCMMPSSCRSCGATGQTSSFRPSSKYSLDCRSYGAIEVDSDHSGSSPFFCWLWRLSIADRRPAPLHTVRRETPPHHTGRAKASRPPFSLTVGGFVTGVWL